MAKLLRVILAAFLALAFTASTAVAANDTAETADVVSSATPSVHGNLVGNLGGTYRYYRFSYPGGNAPIQIHLTWNPGWQATGPAFGFNVYGPNGLVGQGIRGDDAGAASTSNLTFTNTTPGDYLVQVYNYTPGSSQDYTVDFTGLGAAPAPVVNNNTPDKAVVVGSQSLNTSGSLVGNPAGAFAFFNLDYPGGKWPMNISLSFSPATQLPSGVFGFNVYRGDQLVARSTEISRTGDTATATASISEVAPDPYTLQIVNYSNGVTASYAIGVTGLTGTIVNATGNSNGDQAIRLDPSKTGGSGTIMGNSAGAFAYYGFNYQGNNETVGVVLNFHPGYSLTNNGIGFKIYKGADVVGTTTSGAGHDGNEGVAYETFSSDQPGYYVIQVFNYVPSIQGDYTVRVLGIK